MYLSISLNCRFMDIQQSQVFLYFQASLLFAISALDFVIVALIASNMAACKKNMRRNLSELFFATWAAFKVGGILLQQFNVQTIISKLFQLKFIQLHCTFSEIIMESPQLVRIYTFSEILKKYFIYIQKKQYIAFKKSNFHETYNNFILVMGQNQSFSEKIDEGSVSSITRRRIENEKKQIMKNPPTHWKLTPTLQWNVWNIWVTAPTSCPYHTTPFLVIVTFPWNYPDDLPRYKLVNYQRFFHPNISPYKGTICQQTLKNNDGTLSLRDRIDGFVNVLSVPNPYSPLNPTAAQLYISSPRAYFRKAFVMFNGK